MNDKEKDFNWGDALSKLIPNPDDKRIMVWLGHMMNVRRNVIASLTSQSPNPEERSKLVNRVMRLANAHPSWPQCEYVITQYEKSGEY